MPYLIGDKLIVGILLHKTDLFALCSVINLSKRFAVKEQLSFRLTVRSQGRLQQSEQRRLSAAGSTEHRDEFAVFYSNVDIMKSRSICVRIGKAQIFDRNLFQRIPSPIFNTSGVTINKQYNT